MATYAIGDIQGCYDELQMLLKKINYNELNDELWFVGDLVNRGPKSLETLQFIMKLKNKKVVLGNHDLHLLSLAFNNIKYKKKHTLEKILLLNQKNKISILNWLKSQPLLYYDKKRNYLLVHAGVPPQWDINEALKYAQEVHKILNEKKYKKFLLNMYGDRPNIWNNNITGWKRLRYISNAFTRIRFLDKSGKMILQKKGTPEQYPHLIPWYNFKNRKTKNIKIIFGHWSALNAKIHTTNLFSIDSGCIWGGTLTAFRLEDHKRFSVTKVKG